MFNIGGIFRQKKKHRRHIFYISNKNKYIDFKFSKNIYIYIYIFCEATHNELGSLPPVSYGYQNASSSKKIDIPNGRVGVIIRKGDYLQIQTGAMIQVTRDMDADPNSPTRMVELMGNPEQIAKAEQLITDVLSEVVLICPCAY